MPIRNLFRYVVFFLATVAVAQASEAEPQLNQADTAWVLVCAGLVLFMTPGLAFFYGGLVRTKNAGNVLMKNLMDFSFAALGFFIFGFNLMGAVLDIKMLPKESDSA